MAERFRFERGVRHVYPSVRGGPLGRRGGFGFIYSADLGVPFYGTRRVKIRFLGTSPVPKVFVDGPTDSPHRYSDGTLCFQHPADRQANRWVFADGLLDLLDTVVAHLFREAWWRETGEWLGPEAAHLPDRPKEDA
jgi:hypothetical protein